MVGVVDDLAGVFAVHEAGGDQKVGGGAVAGHGDVPEDREAEQGLDIGVVGLGGEGVPEEKEEVEFRFGDHGPNLGIAA